MKEKTVIKIGGSLLYTKDNKLNSKKITEFCSIITSSNYYGKPVIVCGGGAIAREYIEVVRSFKGNEALCDIFGIDLSRINAKLIVARFQDTAYPQVPKSIEELSKAILFENKITVMGGLQPGQSTTSVALEIAEFVRSDQLIILTDVDGIYDKDPKMHKDAKRFDRLNYSKLQEIILTNSNEKQATAGEYRIFDTVSLQILKRSKIKVLIMSGENLNNFKNYWKGEKNLIGTIISDK